MEYKLQLLLLLFLALSLISVSAGQSGVSDYRDRLESQCSVVSDEAYINVRDAPYNITLFGRDVERVKCGNLDAYNIKSTGEANTANDVDFSALDFAVGLIPLLLAIGVSGYLSYGYQLDLDEGLILMASSITSFLFGGLAALMIGRISIILWPLQAIFVLLGITAPFVLILFNENIEDDDVKLRLLITGLTSVGLLTSTLVIVVISVGLL